MAKVFIQNLDEFKTHACINKNTYKSAGKAIEKIEKLPLHSPVMSVYQCPFCKKWHIGTTTAIFGNWARHQLNYVMIKNPKEQKKREGAEN